MRFQAYLKFVLPFALAGFLAGAWVSRSPEAVDRLHDSIREQGIANVYSEDHQQTWWLNVGLGTFAGLIVGELVRVVLRKGPAF